MLIPEPLISCGHGDEKGFLFHLKKGIGEVESNGFCQQILDQISHLFPEERPIVIHGVNAREPRDVLYFKDEKIADYKYAIIERKGHPWTSALKDLRNQAEMFLKACMESKNWMKHFRPLNCALVNKYVNGEDSMGYHSDNESMLGFERIIVSISFGATRVFNVKNEKTGK